MQIRPKPSVFNLQKNFKSHGTKSKTLMASKGYFVPLLNQALLVTKRRAEIRPYAKLLAYFIYKPV